MNLRPDTGRQTVRGRVRVHNNDVIIHHNKMISFGRLKKMFDYPSLDKQDENDFRSAHLRSSTSPARLITIVTYIQKPPVHVL